MTTQAAQRKTPDASQDDEAAAGSDGAASGKAKKKELTPEQRRIAGLSREVTRLTQELANARNLSGSVVAISERLDKFEEGLAEVLDTLPTLKAPRRDAEDGLGDDEPAEQPSPKQSTSRTDQVKALRAKRAEAATALNELKQHITTTWNRTPGLSNEDPRLQRAVKLMQAVELDPSKIDNVEKARDIFDDVVAEAKARADVSVKKKPVGSDDPDDDAGDDAGGDEELTEGEGGEADEPAGDEEAEPEPSPRERIRRSGAGDAQNLSGPTASSDVSKLSPLQIFELDEREKDKKRSRGK